MNHVTRLPALFRKESFWILFLLLTAFYWVLNQRFQSLALYSPNQQWVRFHTEWLMRISSGGLSAVDFRIAPLNLLLHLLIVSDPYRIFLSALAGFLVVFLILYGLTNIRTKIIKLLCSLYLVFSPSMLFSGLFVADYVLYLVLFSLATYFLLEFSVSEQVFYLFVFGLIFGLMGLLRFETFWMSALVFLYLFLRYRKGGLFFYYALAALFPIVFLQLSWVFLSFIFQGAVFSLLYDLYLTPLRAIANFSSPIEQFLMQTTWPFFLLYAITILRLGAYRSFYRSALFLSLLVPFLSPFFIRTAVQEMRPVTFASMFFIHYLILFPYIGNLFNERRQKWFYSLFIVGYFVLNVFAFTVTPERHEAMFFKRFTDANYHIPETTASFLGAKLANKRLIADERSVYPVLQYLPDLSRILYPDHPLYSSAVFTPSVFADAIVMRKGEDRVYREYLKGIGAGGGFNGFETAWEDEEYLVLERVPDP